MRSQPARLAALLLSASAMVTGCSPPPCVNCAQLSGVYAEVIAGNDVQCGDGSYLRLSNVVDDALITQNGSGLTLDDQITGVLHPDLSATFGPIPENAVPVDSTGMPDPSHAAAPGRVYVDGFFTSPDDGPISFSGTLVFIADTGGCEVDSSIIWTTGGGFDGGT